MEAILVAAESRVARLCAHGRIGRFTVAVSACGLSLLVLKGMHSAALRLAGPTPDTTALTPSPAADVQAPAEPKAPASASALAAIPVCLREPLLCWGLPALWGAALGSDRGLGRGQLCLCMALSVGTCGLIRAVFWPSLVPFTGRPQYLQLLPAPVEALLGTCLFRSHLRLAAQKPPAAKPVWLGQLTDTAGGPSLPRDEALVNEVFGRITAPVKAGHGGGDQGHLQGLQWEVVTLLDDEPEASAFAGGKVVVTTGLLRLLDRQPDLLAAVLGHEVAHVVARHGAEGVVQVIWLGAGVAYVIAGVALLVAACFAGCEDRCACGCCCCHRRCCRCQRLSCCDVGFLAREVANGHEWLFKQTGARRLWSPTWEADVIGLKLMALAGYDPARAPEAVRRLPRHRYGRLGRAAAVEKEVEAMAQAGPDQACERVFTRPPSGNPYP
ncbi:hypothetical protein HYH03_005972 [Edaphochlamys debaryana]|uniref:Peptidase M48 domain-containing protein n=1 Tax=Edaphochlamys debaryana TaxID=47281 RepID=A0A835Y4Y2_9CHLO|nr:hypothetical protein HYH03_005972 [Edaphochlamys debaryana]|eukprot:KAG2496053.1 hypothetical protein HYH03_005972 [Edaphochlamys debaryana]